MDGLKISLSAGARGLGKKGKATVVWFVVSVSFIIFSEFLHFNPSSGDLTVLHLAPLIGFVVPVLSSPWHCSKTSCNSLLWCHQLRGQAGRK